LYFFRYEFDDPMFDEVLQWTNDFAGGDGFLNLNLFLPKFINAIIESKVNKIQINLVFICRCFNEYKTLFCISNSN